MKEYFLIGPEDRIHAVPVDKGLSLGRSPINQIVLNERMISRVHARVTMTPRGALLKDCDSANGSHLNGVPVKEALLQHGDSLRLGTAVFCVLVGTRRDAEAWVARRHCDTPSDHTITDLNVNQIQETDLIGDLASLPTIDLLQGLIEQKRHGCLSLTDCGQLLGRVYLANGLIVYAETVGGLKGREAFFDLAATQRGKFSFRPGVPPPMLSIMESPAGLLMEACRLLDERRAGAGSRP
jgi:hypothetical protein